MVCAVLFDCSVPLYRRVRARPCRRRRKNALRRLSHALRRWSSAGTARPINIRVAKTSCTRAVDGSGLSVDGSR
eukprot:scaffold17086_cov78-Phaeocystis_antarctica.AAC.1